jgi:hypothetical protein
MSFHKVGFILFVLHLLVLNTRFIPSSDEFYELYDALISTASSFSSRLFSSAPQVVGASVKSAMVNLTQTDFDPFVLQMQLLAPDQCRWLDDGMNLEYLYCSPDPSLTFCEFIHLMQHNCTFISK